MDTSLAKLHQLVSEADAYLTACNLKHQEIVKWALAHSHNDCTQPPAPEPPVVTPPAPPAGGGFGPLQLFETRVIGGGQRGVAYTMQAAADGEVSVEVSGSPMVTCSVGGQSSTAAGSSSPLPVAKDQYFTWSYEGGYEDGQTMRPQLYPKRG